ncbi:cofactor-independent phosphoglycerate mutase [Thalassoglobus sp. JC818]|uniref:cofactor-independent phosphoglycerate mutase n=1 Tax=Thalassoglobus sp. JC818 TaxID=3232136 RepID=UPI0034599B7E
MKYALVIPDGCADEAQETLGGKTPLEAANVPNMDEIAKLGRLGQTDNVPESMPSGSDVGTMSLFGYDPLVYHTGRAPLEAAAQGIELETGDWAIRCNLVTVVDGIMKSFTAGQISNDIARELIELLQSHCCGNQHWKFHAGVSYRNLLIYRARGEKAPFATDTYTVPPHDITDQPIADHLPMGSGGCDLRALMEKSVELFQGSEANQKRLSDGLLPATQAWLWGQGSRPDLQLFSERFGVRGAVITAVDLLRGIGKLIGWDVVEVEGATGYLDTDYAAKGRAAIETLNKGHDFVVVHVEATDEASHEGLAKEKVTALEEIDEKIVGPLHRHLREQGDYRIFVCPDHPTFLRTKTHSHGYVPYAFCGSDVRGIGGSAYNEPAARQTKEVIEKGHDLMGTFFDVSRSDSE